MKFLSSRNVLLFPFVSSLFICGPVWCQVPSSTVAKSYAQADVVIATLDEKALDIFKNTDSPVTLSFFSPDGPGGDELINQNWILVKCPDYFPDGIQGYPPSKDIVFDFKEEQKKQIEDLIATQKGEEQPTSNSHQVFVFYLKRFYFKTPGTKAKPSNLSIQSIGLEDTAPLSDFVAGLRTWTYQSLIRKYWLAFRLVRLDRESDEKSLILDYVYDLLAQKRIISKTDLERFYISCDADDHSVYVQYYSGGADGRNSEYLSINRRDHKTIVTYGSNSWNAQKKDMDVGIRSQRIYDKNGKFVESHK